MYLINKNELEKAIKKIKKATPVKAEYDNKFVWLDFVDEDVYVSVGIPDTYKVVYAINDQGHPGLESATLCILLRQLEDLLAKLEEDTLKIEVEVLSRFNNEQYIDEARTNAGKVCGFMAYENMSCGGPVKSWSFDGEVANQLWQSLPFAQQSNNYGTGLIALEIMKDGTANVASTNGHILYIGDMYKLGKEREVVIPIPQKVANVMRGAKKVNVYSTTANIYVIHTDELAMFVKIDSERIRWSENYHFLFRGIKENGLSQYLHFANGKHISRHVEDLAKVIQAKEYKSVTVTIKGHQACVSGNDFRGKAMREASLILPDGMIDGDMIEVMYNEKYLTNALDLFDGKVTIEARPTNRKYIDTPGFITAPEVSKSCVVLMPMHIAEREE